eukprot:CAMPEP_0177696428 /NCGR_PEP_ID=MMETSP0484_2-20121128/3974_1 /TAXON_ID=354590 /ORGANISM="Rhodomonas lens, Strain RHODO" /LENGTH=212 /DNA_ID=CAMNT_0019207397 /DNA_START=305 /DNA_END=939 /DNA_ORIENTATION=-
MNSFISNNNNSSNNIYSPTHSNNMMNDRIADGSIPYCEKTLMEKAFTQMMKSCTGDSLHKRQMAMHDASISSLYFTSKPFQALVTTRSYRLYLLVLATWSLISSMHYFRAIRSGEDQGMLELRFLRLSLQQPPPFCLADSDTCSNPSSSSSLSLHVDSLGLMIDGHHLPAFGATLHTEGGNATLSLPGPYRANGVYWKLSPSPSSSSSSSSS